MIRDVVAFWTDQRGLTPAESFLMLAGGTVLIVILAYAPELIAWLRACRRSRISRTATRDRRLTSESPPAPSGAASAHRPYTGPAVVEYIRQPRPKGFRS